MNRRSYFELAPTISRRGTLLVALLAVALFSASASYAQSGAKSTTSAKASAKPAAQADGKGANEGIKVHGHWTIVVKNRDGKIASRTQFENSFVGAETLVGLLSGNQTSGPWMIAIAGSPSPCSSGANGCYIAPPQTASDPQFFLCVTSLAPPFPTPQPFCYATLTETLNLENFSLSGQAYVDTTTSITSVGTYLNTCPGGYGSTVINPSTVSPSTCASSGGVSGLPFTAHTLASPGIAVVSGQTVQATVQISFQ
jgi:hypothetical protein